MTESSLLPSAGAESSHYARHSPQSRAHEHCRMLLAWLHFTGQDLVKQKIAVLYKILELTELPVSLSFLPLLCWIFFLFPFTVPAIWINSESQKIIILSFGAIKSNWPILRKWLISETCLLERTGNNKGDLCFFLEEIVHCNNHLPHLIECSLCIIKMAGY